MNHYDQLRGELKETLPGIAQSFIILLLIIFIKPNPPLLIAGFLTYTLTKNLLAAKKESWAVEQGWGKRLLQQCATLTLVILFLLVVNYLVGPWGFIGLLITVIMLSGVILYQQRKQYFMTLRRVERMIWGMTAEERRDRRRKK